MRPGARLTLRASVAKCRRKIDSWVVRDKRYLDLQPISLMAQVSDEFPRSNVAGNRFAPAPGPGGSQVDSLICSGLPPFRTPKRRTAGSLLDYPQQWHWEVRRE